MTVFEWCDKNPDKELLFKYKDGLKVGVKNGNLYDYDDYELTKDIDTKAIEKQLSENKNIYLLIRKSYGIHLNAYDITFCSTVDYGYKYKKLILRDELAYINSKGPYFLDFFFKEMFDDVTKIFCDVFLGRDK